MSGKVGKFTSKPGHSIQDSSNVMNEWRKAPSKITQIHHDPI
jgi:hypothetical protein